MKAGLEATDRAKIQRQKVEKQRAVGFSCKADELSLCLRGRRVVDVLEVGRLAAKPGPVINNLAVDFSRCVVDKRQGLYPFYYCASEDAVYSQSVVFTGAAYSS